MSPQTISLDNPIQAPPSAPNWVLSGCLPPEKSLKDIEIDTGSFVIGRRPGCDLQVFSQCVSGRHAEILLVGEQLFIRDLNSTNGTYLNRAAREPADAGW